MSTVSSSNHLYERKNNMARKLLLENHLNNAVKHIFHFCCCLSVSTFWFAPFFNQHFFLVECFTTYFLILEKENKKKYTHIHTLTINHLGLYSFFFNDFPRVGRYFCGKKIKFYKMKMKNTQKKKRK